MNKIGFKTINFIYMSMLRKRIFCFLTICVVVLGGFFVLPRLVIAAAGDVIISEIMYDPSGSDTDHEWVELFNQGIDSVTIIGGSGNSAWRFNDGSNRVLSTTAYQGSMVISQNSFIILSQNPSKFKEDYPDFNGTIIQVSAMSLNNTEATIGLRIGTNGSLWSQILYNKSQGASGNNRTLERKGLTDNFLESLADKGTPGADNSVNNIPTGPVCGNGTCETGEDTNNCLADCSAPLPPVPTPLVGDLVINEFLPSPPSGQNEWIEIYNKTANSFDLTGWKIYDGSGSAILTLSSSISAHGFLAADLSSARLNNGGDIIILKDLTNTIFDQVAYGDWEDSNLDDNASTPATGNTIARKIDGQDTDIDKNDFVETTTPTRGSANTITSSVPPVQPSDSFSASDVVINEFMPNPAEGKEWIEFYLNKNSDISLDSWKVYDNTTNVILTLSGNLTTASRFAVFELSSSRLNNDGDTVVLKSPDGANIDQVIYGKENNNAPVPTKAGQSVARASNGVDSDSDKNDFLLSDSPTKGATNIIFQTETLSGSSDASQQIHAVSKPLILINEFASDPTDGEEEWVELYNAGEVSVDMSGWYLEDGSNSKTEISGTSIPGQFKIISPIKGNLNNDGDIIFLKDNQGNIFDQVAYGSWQDGNLLDNAPSASDPNSVARLSDGYSSNNPAKDFFIASTPTKGKSNTQEQNSINGGNAKIVINELWPNPLGDENQEFIELKNLESFSVCLNGWQVNDESTRHYTLNNVCLPAGGLAVLKRSQTGLALNNDADSVILSNADGVVKDKMNYQKAKESLSFSRGAQEWAWTSQPTPGRENVFALANHAPQAVINAPSEIIINQSAVFDAGDSSDEDDDVLSYNWTIDDKNFNSEVVHYNFNTLGEHAVKLAVTDGKESITKELKVFVAAKAGEELGGNLLISEIFPNPVGSDSVEWVEIYNAGETRLDLKGFKIDDEEGGSRPYVLDGLKIEPKSFLVLERAQTKIAFNNDQDSARLFDSAGHLLDSVAYDKAPEGLSFSRQPDGRFIWTMPSKGVINQTAVLADELGELKNGKKSSSVLEVSLSQARQEDLGETIKTQGVVSVTPDLFGKQIFYLSGSGMQVYMSKADFPELKIGDLVQVEGELGETQGERRIKVSSREGIKVINNGPAPAPKEITAGEIGEENVGYFVSIAGNVSEINNRQITLDNDGAEAIIYLKTKTGLTNQIFPQGADVRVKGILGHNQNGYQILPRFKEDIEIIGTPTASTEENLSVADKKAKTRNYLAVTLGGAMSLLLAVGLRRRIWNSFPFNSVTAFLRDRQKR